MSRIVHIALKCASEEKLNSAKKFYEDIFGIYETKRTHERGHISQHMTDGNIDLALMCYDSENEKEAKLAGAGPQIHHIGIEVESREGMIKKIEENGGTIFSDRAEGALKYHAPDGTLGEIVAKGRYPTDNPNSRTRISHVVFWVNDLSVATAFYTNVFEFTVVKKVQEESTVVLTDGDTTLTLRQCHEGEKPAIKLWGMEVEALPTVIEQIGQYGGSIVAKVEGRSVTYIGPDESMGEVVAK